MDKNKLKAQLKETVDTVVFVVVAVIIIRFFIGEIRWIPSLSMYPELQIKDRLFVERFSRFYSSPKRGDIMVFYPPETKLSNSPVDLFKRLTGFGCKDIAYIKRVIALPGETYEIKVGDDGNYHVFIDGNLLKEDYLNGTEFSPCTEEMHCGPEKIPENQYLMLGDNRSNSQDGRYWGLLKKDRFVGKAKFLFWPFNRVKYFGTVDYDLPENK